MDVEDKSVEVDFEWVKNLVSDGKIREHGLATERSTSPKFLLLDVRRAEELEEDGMIPGSVNLPHSDIPQALALTSDEFLCKFGFVKPTPTDRQIIVTCRSGRRVGLAHAMLLERGFNQLTLYRGSLIDWKSNGGPIAFPSRDRKPPKSTN